MSSSPPADPAEPGICNYVFRGKGCDLVGDHYCEPRADKFVLFCSEVLVHTKGDFARQRFVLDEWQEYDIARPVFGTVRWDEKRRRYVRRYTIVWVEIARKNGKTELAAAVVIFLLVADDEEGAEIYGAARTTKQAGKVSMVADRMRQLVPSLNGHRIDPKTRRRGRLKYNKANRRLYYEETASFYEVIATDDPDAELGSNPHGVVIDEFLAQASSDFYESQRTAMGTRAQAMMFLLTTAGNNPTSFGATKHAEMVRILEDPERAPHVFVYIRSLPTTDEELEQLQLANAGHPDLPVSIDPFDERNWYWPNPALRSFKDIDRIREEAIEARNEPARENAFRQFQLDQWVSQQTRWIQLHTYDLAAGLVVEEDLLGRPCWGGLDVSSTTDLTAWVLLFPPLDDDGPFDVLWRAWTPEAKLADLDAHLGGQATQWATNGLLYATEGDWIDYRGDPETGMSHSVLLGRTCPSLHKQIELDAGRFAIQAVGYDNREATATAQYMSELGLTVRPIRQGYGLSEALKEIYRLVKLGASTPGHANGGLRHGGHPVARWHVDSAEVIRDSEERIKLVKPDRNASGARVDLLSGLADAFAVMLAPPEPAPHSALDEYAKAMSWTCECGRVNAKSVPACKACGLPQT